MFFFGLMALIATYCALSCICFSIKYWKRPREITPGPLVLMVIGLSFLISAIYITYITLPQFTRSI